MVVTYAFKARAFVPHDDNSCGLLAANVIPIRVSNARSQTEAAGKPVERMGRRQSCMQLDNANLLGTHPPEQFAAPTRQVGRQWGRPESARAVALLKRPKKEASCEERQLFGVERWPHFNNVPFPPRPARYGGLILDPMDGFPKSHLINQNARKP